MQGYVYGNLRAILFNCWFNMSPQQFLQLGPLRLEYRQIPAPDPSRPTLVLLHEGLGSAEQWKDFPLRLAQVSGCGVVTYSRQGYGQSSPVTLPRPLDYLSTDGTKPILPGTRIGDGAVIDHQFNTTDVCIVVKTDLVTEKYVRHYERTAKEAGP